MKSTFEKMGGTYTLDADGIYYPNLVSTDEEPHYGKYGMMRKTYLKEHRPAMYSLYMLEDILCARYRGGADSVVWRLRPDGLLKMDAVLLNRASGGGGFDDAFCLQRFSPDNCCTPQRFPAGECLSVRLKYLERTIRIP